LIIIVVLRTRFCLAPTSSSPSRRRTEILKLRHRAPRAHLGDVEQGFFERILEGCVVGAAVERSQERKDGHVLVLLRHFELEAEKIILDDRVHNVSLLTALLYHYQIMETLQIKEISPLFFRQAILGLSVLDQF
jgi:hypothetical protein